MRAKHSKLALSIFVFLLLFTYSNYAQQLNNLKHIETALRMIGHQVLLSSNDSTSRVLPIKKEQDQYRIEFEAEFEFEPAKLAAIIDSVVTKTKIWSGYIVEVVEGNTGQVVYSFEMNDLQQSDIIPCSVRMQPKGSYSLLFTFLRTYPNNKTSLPVTPVYDSKTGSNWPYYSILVIAILLTIGLFFFLWKRKQTTKSDPNLISLGEYHFDKRNTELLINHQKIELTSKEADLLLLLYNMVNTTVEREVILNKVWGDQGDYVGRTLDVFISKLRKKLEADSNVKIANIRGVGYKLVMEV